MGSGAAAASVTASGVEVGKIADSGVAVGGGVGSSVTVAGGTVGNASAGDLVGIGVKEAVGIEPAGGGWCS